MTGPAQEPLATALRPVSSLYGLVAAARNRLYDRGVLRAHRLPVPVISIGNLTAGGTGKTPLTIHLGRALLAAGARPLVLSRGYRSEGSGTRIVSDGARVLLDPSQGGDEPVLIARSVPGMPVVVDPDRVRGGLFAIARLSPSLVLLDDGYQHRRLARDLDIVLLDAVDPFGRYAMIPSGRLREPFSGLGRADLFVVTHAPEGESLDTLKSVVRRYNARAPIVRAHHRPEALVPLADDAGGGGLVALSRIDGAAVYAFCAIGNPEGFRETLIEAGARLTGFRTFRDHHPFSAVEIGEIVREASRAQSVIVTTEKDAVRIPGVPEDAPFFALRIRMEIAPEEELHARVLAVARGGAA